MGDNVDVKCVFCDRGNFEERLVHEDENFWTIATLGQITDGGYLLLVPKRHVSCVGAMETTEVAKLERALAVVRSAVELEYDVAPIIFEHGIVGQTVLHAHLHILPANIRLEHRIYRDFPDARINFLASFEILRWTHAWEGIIPLERKYLLWVTSEGLIKIVWNPPAPKQYLRTITAELLGRPERGDWKNMDPGLDRRLWSETVARMKPYFS